MWSQGSRSPIARAVHDRLDVDARLILTASARACHHSSGIKPFRPAFQPGPAPPGQLDRGGHPPVAAAEHPFQQAGFDCRGI